jgi:hypothetical protein
VSRFPVEALTVTGGSCSALEFNNPIAGVDLGLFWRFTINFAEVDYGGRCQPSMTVDWVPWQPPTWPQLVGHSVAGSYGDQGIEATFYTYEHDIGDRSSWRCSTATAPSSWCAWRWRWRSPARTVLSPTDWRPGRTRGCRSPCLWSSSCPGA